MAVASACVHCEDVHVGSSTQDSNAILPRVLLAHAAEATSSLLGRRGVLIAACFVKRMGDRDAVADGGS